VSCRRWNKVLHILKIYICAQSADYGLKLCSAACENVPEVCHFRGIKTTHSPDLPLSVLVMSRRRHELATRIINSIILNCCVVVVLLMNCCLSARFTMRCAAAVSDWDCSIDAVVMWNNMYKTEVTTEVLVSVEVADCCLHRKLENSNFIIIIISFLSEHMTMLVLYS